MSVLFPKINKAPEWHWRPIYYDPKKDEMERKLRDLQAKRAAEEAAAGNTDASAAPGGAAHDVPYTPTLHRGSFREAHEENMPLNQRAARQSKAVFWVVLLAMLAFLYWLL